MYKKQIRADQGNFRYTALCQAVHVVIFTVMGTGVLESIRAAFLACVLGAVAGYVWLRDRCDTGAVLLQLPTRLTL